MNQPQMTRIAIGVAFAIVIIAVVVRALGPNKVDTTGIGDAFVNLAPVASKVNRIEVDSGTGLSTAQRTDGAWTVTTREGFPAEEEALQGLVRSLIALKKSQRMTAMPERHAELGLAWPDPKNETRLVRIYAEGSDAPATEVLVGRSVTSPPGVFVRTPNDNQAWRCTGTIPPQQLPAAWLDSPISEIAADDLKSVECLGAVMTKENGQWQCKLPDGSTHPRDSAMRSTLPYLLSGFAPDDVRKETAADLGHEGQVVAAIRLDDQHTVEARLWMEGDDIWLRFAPGECGESVISEKLAQYSPRWQGWVFKVPSWKAGQYKGLFEDAAPEAAHDGAATDHAPPMAPPFPAPAP